MTTGCPAAPLLVELSFSLDARRFSQRSWPKASCMSMNAVFQGSNVRNQPAELHMYLCDVPCIPRCMCSLSVSSFAAISSQMLCTLRTTTIVPLRMIDDIDLSSFPQECLECIYTTGNECIGLYLSRSITIFFLHLAVKLYGCRITG